ncbi:hypothetical protein AVEN_66036-1 [Araneus ventricosus]|uniref:Uncharacterized protein n=1 Tax=Araneus ventricosus TaxID=182803 RepID=A0A4Y2SFI3_ARAVE|nr:hypothetical protein AVEN_66036-1 [Araneus ventricosus]
MIMESFHEIAGSSGQRPCAYHMISNCASSYAALLHHPSVTKPYGMSVQLAGCGTDEPILWPTSASIAVCFLCLILGTCILGTVLDVIIRYQVETHQHSDPDCK